MVFVVIPTLYLRRSSQLNPRLRPTINLHSNRDILQSAHPREYVPVDCLCRDLNWLMVANGAKDEQQFGRYLPTLW